MKVKIFALISIWLVFSISIMGVFHFQMIRDAEYGMSINTIESQSEKIANQLSFKLKDMKLSMEAFSLKLDTGEVWLDTVTDFLNMNTSVMEVHLYDEDRLHLKEHTRYGNEVGVEKKSLEGMFFYQPMILEQYDNENVLIYYKGKNKYLVYLVNLNELFSSNLSGSKGMQGVYDQHVVPVVQYGEDFNSRDFFERVNTTGNYSGYANEVFYSIENISLENMTYSVLVVRLDQTYQKAIRLYLVRFIIISVTLLVMGFLVAWKVVKVYRQALLSENLGKISELKDIRKNITQAIDHMGMAAKSFDDISVLKEELEILYIDLVEGVDNNERQDKLKKSK